MIYNVPLDTSNWITVILLKLLSKHIISYRRQNQSIEYAFSWIIIVNKFFDELHFTWIRY